MFLICLNVLLNWEMLLWVVERIFSLGSWEIMLILEMVLYLILSLWRLCKFLKDGGNELESLLLVMISFLRFVIWLILFGRFWIVLKFRLRFIRFFSLVKKGGKLFKRLEDMLSVWSIVKVLNFFGSCLSLLFVRLSLRRLVRLWRVVDFKFFRWLFEVFNMVSLLVYLKFLGKVWVLLLLNLMLCRFGYIEMKFCGIWSDKFLDKLREIILFVFG